MKNISTLYKQKGLRQEKKIKPEDAEKEAKALRNINPECGNVNEVIRFSDYF